MVRTLHFFVLPSSFCSVTQGPLCSIRTGGLLLLLLLKNSFAARKNESLKVQEMKMVDVKRAKRGKEQ